MRNCLDNDKTVIYHVGGKLNYQLNQAHRFQYLIQGDDKIQNSRGASATTAKEATNRQFSDYWHGFPQPTHSITHTYIATDRLVFNTHLHLRVRRLDRTTSRTTTPAARSATTAATARPTTRATPNCLWNQQQLPLRTTGFRSRSLLASIQRLRPTHELKTDGTYFVSNKLGGDHSLKFGVGYRRAPTMTFSHYAGGARAYLQCNGNTTANCADNRIVPGAAGPGLVPVPRGALPRRAAQQHLVELQRLHPGLVQPRQVHGERRAALRLAALEVRRRLRAGERDPAGSAAGTVRGGDAVGDQSRTPARWRRSGRSATGRRGSR